MFATVLLFLILWGVVRLIALPFETYWKMQDKSMAKYHAKEAIKEAARKASNDKHQATLDKIIAMRREHDKTIANIKDTRVAIQAARVEIAKLDEEFLNEHDPLRLDNMDGGNEYVHERIRHPNKYYNDDNILAIL